MKIIVLGGDGFSGWPTSLELSRRGHRVLILDNFSRRDIDAELNVMSLTPIQSLETRLAAWEEVTGELIEFRKIDISHDYSDLVEIITSFCPETIVHFAEQRAAPYSMKSARHRRFTVENNIQATHNVLTAIVESGLDIHLIHLGTMGVYGYGAYDMAIPEGYLQVKIADGNGSLRDSEILHPAYPGSIYHMTKALDQLMFQFYNKNDKVRITDLHQGIIWGTQTVETARDLRLMNRFDYDGDFGTVLNRFLMQAAIHHPLTVHGTGGQTRAFINLQDTVRCVVLAVENPANGQEKVRILNQMTEVYRIRDLAKMVATLTGAEIHFLDNPREEADQNDLHVSNNTLLTLGLKPITLSDGLMTEITDIARAYAHRCKWSSILATACWNKNCKRRSITAKGNSMKQT
jgi:UDP-sulfoquinovose synthase